MPFFAYRAPWSFFGNTYGNDQQHNVWRASATYVTGAHSMKFGYQAAYQVQNPAPRSRRHRASRTTPFFAGDADLARPQRIARASAATAPASTRFYVQDQWTRKPADAAGRRCATSTPGAGFPAGRTASLGTSRFTAAPIIFPRTDGVTGYHDITPRMGVAYDVFGNGKTSIKVNFSKYLQPANNESTFTPGNPGVSFCRRRPTGPGPMPTATSSPNCDLQ